MDGAENMQMDSESNRVRWALLSCGSVLTVLLALFTWIMMGASDNPMSDRLGESLLIVALAVLVTQAVYCLKGRIFEDDGHLATGEILTALICFQCIVQLGFGFAIYAVDQARMQNEGYDAAYAHFAALQQQVHAGTAAEYARLDLNKDLPECIDLVSVATGERASDASFELFYRFPIKDGKLLMQKSLAYMSRQMMQFAISMLAALVISILLMVELVQLAIKLISSHADSEPMRPANYLRQLAFLFYFGAFLGNSFIPIQAHELSAGLPVDANFMAGLPYSVEALANCAAILLATKVFEKKGWKWPHLLGATTFAVGAVGSAIAPNIQLFIAARGVAGLGYGFCWMTLRNITTLSQNRSQSFSNLVSGIYAGLMCSVAFGAVLSDKIGYRNVLLLSAALTVALALFPMRVRNEIAKPRAQTAGGEQKLTAKNILAFLSLLLLVVVPTSISEAFTGYVSPLHVSAQALPTAYAGYVSLLYNLATVYIGSTVLIRLVWIIRSPVLQNVCHMLLTAGALVLCGRLDGMAAVAAPALVLGAADGFGFSVQNAYVLETDVAQRVGSARMLSYLSLLKKLGATLGPLTFSLFMRAGTQGMVMMGILFAACGVAFLLSQWGLKPR